MQPRPTAALLQVPPERARLIGYAGLALAVCALLVALSHLPTLTTVVSDFTYDYIAGLALRTGMPLYEPFQPEVFSAEALQLDAPLRVSEPLDNIHPPFAALLFAPLSLLPYDVAVVLWSLLSALAYIALILIVLRELEIKLARHWMALLVGLALCWYPFQGHMALGQLSLLLALLMVGAWALLHHERPLLAGGLIGLACLIKLFPGMLLVYLLLRRHWRAAAAALGTMGLGAALVLLVVGPATTLQYFTQAAPAASRSIGLMPINLSLTGVINRLLMDGGWVEPIAVAPALAAVLGGLVALAVLAVLVSQTLRLPDTRRGDDVAFGLCCLAMLLISPITWQHVLPVLLPLLALLLREAFRGGGLRRAGLTLLALLVLSMPDIEIARGLMALFEPYRMPWAAALLLLAPTLGLVLLWWLAVATLPQRSGRIAAGAPTVPHT